MIKIVITGEKGGTGKSTLACLLVEYLTYQQKKVQLIDTDPLQTAQTCGASLLWINQADILIVPLVLHYADLRINTKEQREGLEQLKKTVVEPRSRENSMRDIYERKKKIIASKKISTSKGKFAWELDSHLLAKCENVIKSQKFPRQFTGLSDLIRQSLIAYKKGQLKLTVPRAVNSPKRQISVRLPNDLRGFYEILPLFPELNSTPHSC
ncbi:515_t:CDS:2 [Cetraspora pellucida]|uniref:515_t:CDS:1 n=1 Tax=Cetraspora pellucida TaxID=1433469 RepID=A0ACA9LUN2_9GLOM|nr:515_t:CDS:2 [Cetraspora pellucida]